MASNNYNSYNYPYQQSSAQQYSAYQTAPAANNVAQPLRHHQQPPTSQGFDYMSYQGQSYSGQTAGYGTAQDSTWNGNSYTSSGNNRETTSRAAEVLHNMNSTSYSTPNTIATSQPGFTAANTATSQPVRYAPGSSNSPRLQTQQTHAAQPSSSQAQNRPRSVNANRAQQSTSRGLPSPATAAGYPSQRAQTIYNRQQQRSASPAQHQYGTDSATPTASSRNPAVTAATTQQYTDYDRRQLASVEASRSSQSATPPAPYNCGSTPTVAPLGPIAPPPSTMADSYTGQGSITVDPTAVYDPWPGYQRKQDALRAQKDIEDPARKEEERIAEETRKVEEAKKEEERKRQEALVAASQPRQMAKEAQKQQATFELAQSPPEPAAGPGDALEAEIRAMMAKIRELNGKDPALLARIWEEERRAKAAPKFPTARSKPTAPAAVAAPAPASNPQTSSQRKKAASKESSSTSAAKPATPISASAVAVRSQPASASARQGGNTIWPPEKKAQLASAAATYLNGQNPGNHVEPARVLAMLNGNPSYIELCEQLEGTGLKLDRAAFAKNLLTAVPDVNSSSRKTGPQPVPVQRAQVPAAVMKKEIATPSAASPGLTPAAASPANRLSYPPFPDNASPADTPAPVAEMVPIRPELKPPANKEEAARKRNLSDLVDLTLLDEEEDMGPPLKRINKVNLIDSYGSPYHHTEEAMIVDSEPVINNFPIATMPSRAAPRPTQQAAAPPASEFRYRAIVEPLDRNKALRRNNYNPATIARDVLLACGRHPLERQLNQHLDVLRENLPYIGFESDLSTIKWDVIDPGRPPPGYFKDSVQALTEDADDEDDSEDEGSEARPRAHSNAIGGESGAQARVQALPEAINPFTQQKKRGRPGRHSLPATTTPATPKRSPSATNMSASAPRSSATSVGYSAFRSATQYGPDGQPLPKKRGRPVGWRKAIHGSATAQSKPAANGFTGPNKHQPSQPSSLRHVRTGGEEPIRIESRSSSVANHIPRYQSYKCKCHGCSAELHNLDTLKKHVFKVHRKETLRNTLECLWDDCGREVTNFDPNTNIRLEKHTPYSFDLVSNWKAHIQQRHFDPLSWELGDGPASGLSDAHDSEVYLSDAQGRQVTPRITVDHDRVEEDHLPTHTPSSAPRRVRPLKNTQEREAREAQERLVSQKRRIGGPGMDRGGATLVNDKRRKGFLDGDGTEEELVDVEE